LRKAVALTSLFFYAELVVFLCCCVWSVEDMRSWLWPIKFRGHPV